MVVFQYNVNYTPERNSDLQINRIQKINFSTNVSVDGLKQMDWLVDSSIDNQHELILFHTYDEENDDYPVAAMSIKPCGKDAQLIVPVEPMEFYDFGEEFIYDKLSPFYGITLKQSEYVYCAGPYQTEGEIEDDHLEKGYKYIASYAEESAWEVDTSKIKKSLMANPKDFMVVMRCVYNGELELDESGLKSFDPFDHEDAIEFDEEMQAMTCIYKK